MSLELKIEELTAAVKLLTTVMASAGDANLAAGEVGTEAGGEEGKGKRTRRTKAQIEADAAAASAGTAQVVAQPTVNTNTTGAVIYVIVDKNNTAAAIQPGEIIPSIEGLRQVTEAEYTAYKAQQAAAHTAATVTASPAPAPAPTGDLSFPALTQRLIALHTKAGTPPVQAVLTKFGVANVPSLSTKPLAEVAAAVHEQEVAHGLAAAPGASLF